MMPVVDMGQTGTVNYKQKYKTLKRKLRFLVYEQECFLEELRKTQRKLLKVSRDRSFLLDRLLQYEKIDDSSSDSDGTASSESDTEGHKDGGSNKKKKTPPVHSVNMFPGGDQAAMLNTMGFASMMAGHSNVLPQSVAKTPEPAKKKAKTNPKKSATKSASKSSKSGSKGTHKHDSGVGTVPMTREEVERHLESSQRNKPQFLSIEKVASDLPLDIFSNDNSNIDSDQVDGAHTEDGAEDHDLIIDLQ